MSDPERPVANNADQDSKPTTGVSWLAVAFVLINLALGAGVLYFPAAFDKAGGILMSVLVQGLVMLVLGSTALVLAYCSDAHSDSTYHGVLESCTGPKSCNAAALSVGLNCYGACITILIVIGDQFDRLLASLYGDHFCHHWYMSREFTISATTAVFILPLCHLKKLSFLQHASTVGVIAVLYPVFLTIYTYYKTPDVGDTLVKTHPSTAVDFIVAFPVFCVSYEMHELVVPAYASMKNRNMREFGKAVVACLLFLFMVYVLIGCYGYATYGSAVKPDVMQMFDARDPTVIAGIAALIIKMIASYPLLAFCGRECVEGLYLKLRKLSPEDAVIGERKRAFLMTMVWLVTSTGLSILPVHIGVVVKFLGCVCMFNIFIFPGLCLTGLARKKPDSFRHGNIVYFLGWFFIVVGFVLFGLVLVDTIMFDLASGEVHHICV